jgi:hypothetical protein
VVARQVGRAPALVATTASAPCPVAAAAPALVAAAALAPVATATAVLALPLPSICGTGKNTAEKPEARKNALRRPKKRHPHWRRSLSTAARFVSLDTKYYLFVFVICNSLCVIYVRAMGFYQNCWCVYESIHDYKLLQ